MECVHKDNEEELTYQATGPNTSQKHLSYTHPQTSGYFYMNIMLYEFQYLCQNGRYISTLNKGQEKV